MFCESDHTFLQQVISGKIEEITVPEQVPHIFPCRKDLAQNLHSNLYVFLKGGRNHIGADGLHAPQ